MDMPHAIVDLGDVSVELSRPLEDRPEVLLVKTSDGRFSVIGDGAGLYNANEILQFLTETGTR